jgi:hypothetical protein
MSRDETLTVVGDNHVLVCGAHCELCLVPEQAGRFGLWLFSTSPGDREWLLNELQLFFATWNSCAGARYSRPAVWQLPSIGPLMSPMTRAVRILKEGRGILSLCWVRCRVEDDGGRLIN